MPTVVAHHSKSQIDKAGKAVRRAFQELREPGSPVWDDAKMSDVFDAMDVVEDFRGQHAQPLRRVNANLRYYVKKVGMPAPDVTQRLKRFSTIIDKLDRQPTMALSKMEDIGGVRAVLTNQRQADDVCACLVKARSWKVRRVRNYAQAPKVDGYRAIHLVVEKDGCYVEIQLRTPWQDTWAQSVEQDTRRLKAGLKFGVGPDDLREYYRMVAELFAMRDRMEQPDQEFMEQLAKRFSETRRYFPAELHENEGDTPR